MKKIEQKDYYLGLDLGSASVGFAATDTEYNILKKKGKDILGFRLFESANTSVKYRTLRSSRRRLDRKQARINLLQELLQSEIAKVDIAFYHRLKESFFHTEDREDKQLNTLFNDTNYKDKDYHKDFPTIYHLRKELIQNTEKKFDIRLIYLAIAHILKKRGHFLFEGQDIDSDSSFTAIFNEFTQAIYENVKDGNEEVIDWTSIDSIKLKEILKEKCTKKDKEKNLIKFLSANDQEKALIKLLIGYECNFYKLFLNDEYKEQKLSINFSKIIYDEKREEFLDKIGDNIALIDSAKAIYDFILLGNILDDEKHLSFAKVKTYIKHEEDLKKLKILFKKYLLKKDYKSFFNDDSSKDNYVTYIGNSMASENKSTCSYEDFTKSLKKLLENCPDDTEKAQILLDIENDIFLPKQNISSNGVVPYQIHLKELTCILENATKHYPCFDIIDKEAQMSLKDKILSLMTFRIPYYIGPLNNYHKKEKERSHSWVVRKQKGKVYPWNFEQKIDIDATAEEFILQMTNKCTYLVGEDVLPKNSIIYSKFIVLNELNNLCINGDKISIELKQAIYKDLFLKNQNVKQKDLIKYLSSTGNYDKDASISGIDGDFKTSMKSYIQLQNILKEKIEDKDLCEDIIHTLTLFGAEKKLSKKRLAEKNTTKLTKEEINALVNLRFSGWGNLSKKFLCSIEGSDEEIDSKTGEVLFAGTSSSILSRLEATNDNLMQILSTKYNYVNKIEDINNAIKEDYTCTPENFNKLVKDLYCSPAAKRSIMQTLRITNEIQEIMGYAPKKIFLEMAREEGEKKRTSKRQESLFKLYNACKKDLENSEFAKVFANLKNTDNLQLQSKKLYLYYTQLGKCMYSGKSIDLDKLLSSNVYDIDHIYPRSLTKDDSFENLVLVDRDLNQHVKKDNYPLPTKWQENTTITSHWNRLVKMKLISKAKYKRLIRTEELTKEELSGFINRQLVETRQSTKATAKLLQKLLPNTKLVFSKASHISDFRRDFNFVKVREINDIHHAHDAYFNIIVGNVYDTKFTSNPLLFLKENKEKRSYNLTRMFDYDVKKRGSDEFIWLCDPANTKKSKSDGIKGREDGKEPTLARIRTILEKVRPLYTRHCMEETGEFYNQNPVKHGKGQIPLKSSDIRLQDISKYGAYNSDSSSYYILVKHMDKKGKEVRSIEYVPVRLAQKIAEKTLSLEVYCKNNLNLTNPSILIKKIKRFTLFNFNGFPMHLTGRQKKELIFAPAVQLKLCKYEEEYIKKIVKFYDRNKINLKEALLSNYEIENRILTVEENIKIYAKLLNKRKETIYNLCPGSHIKCLDEGQKVFETLSLEKQCLALYNILTLFACKSGTSNLELIGAGSRVGSVLKQGTLKQADNPKIIHQSYTGIKSCEIDLFSL